MAKNKFDSVIEAIRVSTDGELMLARLYDRRGAVFSDHKLVNRADLIKRLQEGQTILCGSRIQFLGSEFDTGKKLHLVSTQGKSVIVLGEGQPQQDQLTGIPHF
ncbi:MAG: hypothetical protein CL609_03010 [Anaerolineaceae bacterium]|nr:hypothetical protein [Anaerolineaceae bacterium]